MIAAPIMRGLPLPPSKGQSQRPTTAVGRFREEKIPFQCGNCEPTQRSATVDRALVAGAGGRFEFPRRLSFYRDLQVKRKGKEVSQDLSQPNLPQPYCNPH